MMQYPVSGLERSDYSHGDREREKDGVGGGEREREPGGYSTSHHT